MIAVKKTADFAHFHNPKQLFEREELLDTVQETIEVGIIACDKEGRLTLFNKVARNWHGLPPEEIPQSEYARHYDLYEPDGSLFKTEDIPLLDILQNNKIRKNQLLIRPKDGKPRILLVSGARKEVNGAVIAMHDITNRKEAEEKLKISEKLFRGSFEHAADGMAIADPTGKILEVNNSLAQMLGYPKSELDFDNFQKITHPEDFPKDIQQMQELMNGNIEIIQKELIRSTSANHHQYTSNVKKKPSK